MTDTVLLAAVGFGAGQAFLQLLQVLRHQPASSQSRWLGLLLLCALAYFIQAIVPWPPFALLANLLPGVMWMFCASVFDDHHQTKFWQLAIIGFSAVAPMLAGTSPQLNTPLGTALLLQLPQLLEFIFLLLALFIIARSWRDDLVQARRRLRVGFCGFLVFYALLLIFTREIISPTVAWFPAAQYTISALVLLLINALLLRFGGGVWHDIVDQDWVDQGWVEPDRTDQGAVDQSSTDQNTVEQRQDDENFNGSRKKSASGVAQQSTLKVDNRVGEPDASTLKGLVELMQNEKVYRETGLSIGQLASRLGVPEYRLRQTINQSLGYRNFNDFLNRYRVEEAAERMISSEEKELPVLSIALDVGFKSISSFNKAFKERFDVTPSAYRSKSAQNSTDNV